MPVPNVIIPKVDAPSLPPQQWPSARRQQRFMVIALALLLGALAAILYRDREFWFSDTEQASDTPQQETPSASGTPAETWVTIEPTRSVHTKGAKAHTRRPAPAKPVDVPPPAPVVISARTVLPPLEVEVIAGNSHQSVRPGSNSVKVDTRSTPLVQADAEPPIEVHSDPPVTNSAERARVSTVSASLVAESVRPDYPMLARQMKVQGSVILQALIGRDGLIQDLRVLSGPPILAAAAREAVRQWHFKPHFLGSQAVETETKITVNFTISTN
jgi:TonB family protein